MKMKDPLLVNKRCRIEVRQGAYIGVVHGCIHHYFPWNIGELFHQKKKSGILKMAELSKGLKD